MRRLNSMKSKLSLFTPTKLFLLVILLSGTLVEPRLKTGIDRLLQVKTSKNSNPNLRSVKSEESVTFDAKAMKELVCSSYWFKKLFDRNLPQSILPLLNNDTDKLLWDVVNVFGVKYIGTDENFHTETTNETVKWLLEAHRFWTELTEYTPDHELYDEIWNSFTWRVPTKGFETSKDALNFITELHSALQSSRQDSELTMLMNFFDQPLYFDNSPRLRLFPPLKPGNTFLSNKELPARIRSLIPRDMSVVKAIEEAQNMISYNRKELKYNLRVLNVRTLNLRLITRRCQSYETKTTAADKRAVCGKPLPTARIAGGIVAKQGSWPWMVYIRCSSKDSAWYYVSAGVLISDTHVLTSTHCAFTLKPENLEVYLGEFDFDEFDYSSTLCEVETIFTHEDYNKQGNNEHDIALIKLKEKVIFNNDRHPICLPPPNITLDEKMAFMAGWGQANEEDDKGSRKLLEGATSIWEQAKCVKNYGYEEVTEQQLCIGGVGGVDPCRFDGGGPVMHQTTSGQWMVVGLVSWVYGFGCARLGFPSVSTRVSTYLEWINAKLLL